MTCDLYRDKLDAYADSSCSQEELAFLEEHFRTCSSCAAEALSRIQMKHMTKAAAAARYTPSDDFRRKIEASIWPRPRSRWAFAKLPELAFAAIALVFAIFGSVLWVWHSSREQALAQLVDLHVSTLASANPVDVVSTDRHTVKPWFQGKLPFTFNLPELQNSSFKLVGGRITYFQHSPAAELLFQIRSHQLSVFVLQDRPGIVPLSPGVTDEREVAFNVETWADGGLRFVIVGDASPADIRELGELMRNAK